LLFSFSRKKDDMREQTLVGLYPTRTMADEVRTRLAAEGVDPSDISIGLDADRAAHHETAENPKPASRLWAWLFGSDASPPIIKAT